MEKSIRFKLLILAGLALAMIYAAGSVAKDELNSEVVPPYADMTNSSFTRDQWMIIHRLFLTHSANINCVNLEFEEWLRDVGAEIDTARDTARTAYTPVATTTWSVRSHDADSLTVRQIPGDSITTGTIAEARIHGDIARDAELTSAIKDGTELKEKLDSTAVKIPTAALADDVDTSGTDINAALVSRNNVSQWTYTRVYNDGDDSVITTGEYVGIFSGSWPQLFISNTDGDSVDFGLDADGLTIDANGDDVDVIGDMSIVGNVDVNGTFETTGNVTFGGYLASLDATITNELELRYDVSNYCDIEVDFSGNMYVLATGGHVLFTSTEIGGDVGPFHDDILTISGDLIVSDDLEVTGTINKIRTGKENTDTCTTPYLYRVDISPAFPDTNYSVTFSAYGGYVIHLWIDSALYPDRFWISTLGTDRLHWIAVHE